MIRNYYFPKKAIFFVAPLFLLLLASCGSYQYSGYEDGIYGDSEQQQTSSEELSQNANNNQDQGNTYYKNLFSEKSEFYGQMADNIVFTDVESYSSAEGGEEDEIYYEDQQAYNTGRAPWGEDPDQYTVNIYNTGWNGGFFNPWAWNSFGFGNFYYSDLWWDPFYGPWGGGFGPWGAVGYSPWRGGFLGPWGGGGFGPRWGWGNRFGFGFGGFYNGYWGPGFINNPYYGHQNNYRDIAYNSGRRASYSDYASSNRRDNVSGLRDNQSSYSRSIRAIRSNQNSERSYTRSNTNNSNVYSRSSRRSEPARVNTSSTRRNSNINRSSRSSRSNSTYNRSSNTSSRSSGTVRSSSGSSRSSGTRSSGGGRSSSSRGGGRG